jgi:hypothetical protein
MPSAPAVAVGRALVEPANLIDRVVSAWAITGQNAITPKQIYRRCMLQKLAFMGDLLSSKPRFQAEATPEPLLSSL